MTAWLRVGTSILRRYILVGPLARGGVCEIYQAVDLRHGRTSAVKMLAPAFAGDARARDMMRREAAFTSRVRHPSVPQVYDSGEAPLPDGTVVPYLVLELVAGVPLAGRLARGPLPWRHAVAVAATTADVLAVAHRRGVVHRDLHPMNILLTRAGAKIIDFGLAAEHRSGTDGAPADDVYALGVLLYLMLTGHSPYPRWSTDHGSSPRCAHPALSYPRWTYPPWSPHAVARQPGLAPTPVLLVPGLPGAVAELCRCCMAKRPAWRPDSTTVALALWSLLSAASHTTSTHWAQPEPVFGGGEHALSSPGRAQPEPVFGGGEHAPGSPGRAQPEPVFGEGEHALSSPGELSAEPALAPSAGQRRGAPESSGSASNGDRQSR